MNKSILHKSLAVSFVALGVMAGFTGCEEITQGNTHPTANQYARTGSHLPPGGSSYSNPNLQSTDSNGFARGGDTQLRTSPRGGN